MRYGRVRRLRCATVRCGVLRCVAGTSFRFVIVIVCCAVRLALAHGATQASGISAGSMQIRGLIPFTSSPAFVQPAAWPIIIIIHSQHCAIVPSILSTLCSTVVFTLILSSRIQNPALAFPFSNSRYPLPAVHDPFLILSLVSHFPFLDFDCSTSSGLIRRWWDLHCGFPYCFIVRLPLYLCYFAFSKL